MPYLEYVCMNLERSYGSGLLFYDLPERGPVEILARSLISSGSQTKVNFKVTAFR